jgi:hypothetical protein
MTYVTGYSLASWPVQMFSARESTSMLIVQSIGAAERRGREDRYCYLRRNELGSSLASSHNGVRTPRTG